MLAYSHRFHGYGSLKYVYKNGEATRSRLMTIRFTVNPRRQTSRYSVVIGKKVIKRAVLRNRVRRRVYEIIRALEPGVTTPHDVVVLVFSPEVLMMPHAELVASVEELFRQSNLIS